jgi:hypothetical protein
MRGSNPGAPRLAIGRLGLDPASCEQLNVCSRRGKTGQNDFLTPEGKRVTEGKRVRRENGSERFLDSAPTLFPRRVLSQRVGGNKQF